jgi:alpha-galactosidase
MLEVGVTPGLHKGEAGLTVTESRSHFGAWCVSSSPLTLSLDVRNASAVAAVWDIVSNVEALAVNEAWAAPVQGYVGGPVSFSGTRIAASNVTISFTPCGFYPTCSAPEWEVWAKPLAGGTAALFVLNSNNVTLPTLSVPLASVPLLACAATGCAVRDVWAHADLGTATGVVTVTDLAAHDSAFYTLSAP